ncbi:TonB-dependent receptor plug domain-containing protein [Chryseobacterium sp. APV1]|uniref:TonB-dependent receptor plug domain-containing protein n=1 Tax=Chryseobacterium urinae TaxID=3058400 RepID=A0ABT8TYS4_9FLAO|nr:TonB-dependent receptor plug domain-containing protein [Chryseobacterium sp. APV1]MDO3423949.1 TonB-dependent receptor plug domain-containing protein [Chryseobacterium sp. APV1]
MKFLLLLLFPVFIFSQNIVRGIVSDESGYPVENVLVKNISKSLYHTHTDISGNFSLENVNLQDSLEFVHQDFETQKIVLKNLENMNIILEKKSFQIKEITITKNLKNLNTISKIDLQVQPVASSQDLLRKVPGLFIGQHAGGGKAEQIFLRGFDADHGTDVAISVDGMPVNMVSHAHGQGYADLHFVIPETVESIDFDKGSYFADKGDFATAGFVAFKTRDFVDKSSLGLEIGQFNTFRTNGIFNLLNKNNQSAYFAGEFLMTDNYFDAPQNFNRINLFGKYTSRLSDKDRLSVSVSHFNSKWDASGQIPERAVNSGLISHFGAIDNTEGGTTSRSNFNLQYERKMNDDSFIRNQVYFNKYDFELYSNFTFFMNDPINGDQIRQKDNRTIVGFQSEYNGKINDNISFKTGGGLRNDNNKDIELSHTKNRQTVLQYLSLGDINQTNLFGYGSWDLSFGKWLINAGLRVDYFKFNVVDQLAENYQNQSEAKAVLSPKLNFLYSFNTGFNAFLKLGKGFHSNDARVVIAEKGKNVLPASYNADLGFSWKPLPNLLINASLWYLFLEQEFVYVGDEAVVEPSGKTARKGVDVGLRYQLNNWLFWNTDFTYTHARAIEEAKGSDYIPLAPKTTFVSGLSVKNLKNFSAGINARYLGDRPANEDNSVIAKGYFITDFSVNYQFRKVSVGINIDNIFNTKWKETQFLTESRLQNETESVEEIHYTAGTPFNARLILKYNF